MTLEEFYEEIDTLREEIVHGEELDRKLYEKSTNPKIVATREKVTDWRVAFHCLLLLAPFIGLAKLVVRLTDPYLDSCSRRVLESMQDVIDNHGSNIYHRKRCMAREEEREEQLNF